MLFYRKYNDKRHSSRQSNHSLHQAPISAELKDNLAVVQSLFSATPDLIVRRLVIKQTQSQAALIYLNGISDSKAIFNHVLNPLLFEEGMDASNPDQFVSLGHIQATRIWADIENAILNGESVLFVEKHADAYRYDTAGFPKRSIEDTPIESSLTGAHIGFTENTSANVALIRKHIRNRELKIRELTVGERGNTKLSILYLADVVNPDVLEELEKRIRQLNVDHIINAGVLAEYIEDSPFSPFPQLLLTERPDVAAFEIMQGRIVTVVDRSPSVIIGPVAFGSFFKTIDDYSSRWIVASFFRLLRYFGFFVAIFLPAIYIAIVSFHFEIIPMKLLLSVGASRERIPFPPYIEAFVMEVTLEMLREAGIRLPAKIGQTVGIVGGIVIGQAAVEAGIVSDIMVIVVALTAIASFIIPNYSMSSAIRIVRFPMMLMASLFGFVGIMVGLMIIIAHFIALESLGMPYGTPIAPLRFPDWKDLFVRFPQWSIDNRPLSTKAIQTAKATNNRQEGDDRQ